MTMVVQNSEMLQCFILFALIKAEESAQRFLMKHFWIIMFDANQCKEDRKALPILIELNVA